MPDGERGTIAIDNIGRMTVQIEDPQERRYRFDTGRGIGKAIRQ